MTHDPGARGMGGVLVGAAIAMIAHFLGMSELQVGAVFILISVGLPLAIGGRWKNW